MSELGESGGSPARTFANSIYKQLNGSPSMLVVIIGIVMTVIGFAISDGATAGLLVIYGVGTVVFGILSYVSIRLLQYLS